MSMSFQTQVERSIENLTSSDISQLEPVDHNCGGYLMRTVKHALVLIFASISFYSLGQATAQTGDVEIPSPPVSIYWEDLQRDLSKLNAVDHGLMGESIDLHTGEISFSHTDVSVPGNFDLEVALRRKIVPGLENHNSTSQEFGDWTLDVPYMEILSMAINGENTYGTTRCTDPTEAMPAIWGEGLKVWPGEYSQGLKVNIPGQGKQTVVRKRADKSVPMPASAKYATNDHWYFECTSGADGGENEGFIAYAPNGDKYTFDQWFEQDYYNVFGENAAVVITPAESRSATETVVSISGSVSTPSIFIDLLSETCNQPIIPPNSGEIPYSDSISFSICSFGASSSGGGLSGGGGGVSVPELGLAEISPFSFGDLGGMSFSRLRNVLRATQVEDVHGNWVKYQYDETGRLTRIHSSDSRSVVVNYERDDDLISSITANGRVWNYNYRARNLSEDALFLNFHEAYQSQAASLALSEVLLPDDTKWQFELDGIIARGTISAACETNNQFLSVTHPAGVTAQYLLGERNHRIALNEFHLHWWKNCFPIMPLVREFRFPLVDAVPESFVEYTERATANTMSVLEKRLSGSGIDSATWFYEYEDDDTPGRGEEGLPLVNTPDDPTNWTKVTDPFGGETTYFHYWANSLNGGALKRLEKRNASGELVSETDYDYDASAYYGSVAYVPDNSTTRPEQERSIRFEQMGGGIVTQPVSIKDYASYPRAQMKTFSQVLVDVSQNNDTFTTVKEYNQDPSLSDFSFGHPVLIEKSSSLEGAQSRVQEIDYEHNTNKWILGLPKTIQQEGREIMHAAYTNFGQVESVSKYGTFWESFDYYADGTLNTHTNSSSDVATFTDYYRGKARNITRYDGTSIGRQITDEGWVESYTSARNHTTSYQYNEIGWLEKIIPPAAAQASGEAVETNIAYDYSPGGGSAIKQVVSHGALETTRLMDGFYRVVSEIREDANDPNAASVQTFSYDIESRPVFESLPFAPLSDGSWPSSLPGVETEYDALGRVIVSRQTMAPFGETSYRYLSGNKIEVTDPRLNTTTTTFHTFGAPVSGFPEEGDMNVLPIRIDAPLGADQVFEYDAWGNKRFDRQFIGSSLLAETEYSYNARNLLEWSEDPAGDRSHLYYDEQDRQIVSIDGEERAIRTVYDEMGRVDKLIQGWQGSTSGVGELDCVVMRNNYDPGAGYLQSCYQDFEYDPSGNIDTVTDARGNVTSYTYDALERGERVTYPDGSFTEIEQYDVFGNPLTLRTRAGDQHTSLYDALGRLRSMTTPDRDVIYSYDAADRRTCGAVMTAGGLDLNASPNCSSLAQNLQNRILAEYDPSGRLETESVEIAGQGVISTSYTYDKNNNRTGINWHNNAFAVEYLYDANNRLETVQESAATILGHYDYDAQSRLRAIQYGGENYFTGSGVSQTVFNWAVDSDLQTLSHNFFASDDVSFSYGYDASARLISTGATHSDWMYSPSESMDEYGTANSLNQYPDVNGIAVDYDQNGNRTAFDGLETPHDSENRLEGVGNFASYMYDADGRRIAKTVNGVVTRFLHAGDMEIGEYQDGTLQHVYVPGHSVDQRVAWRDVSAGETYFFHADLQGSVQAVVDSSGALAAQYVYTPFGVQAPLDATGNPFRYTGRRYDPESGLYYYRARYYDAAHGRFLQTDPVGYADQMNLYTYVANDPLNATDPTGEQTYELKAEASGSAVLMGEVGVGAIIGPEGPLFGADLGLVFSGGIGAGGSKAPKAQAEFGLGTARGNIGDRTSATADFNFTANGPIHGGAADIATSSDPKFSRENPHVALDVLSKYLPDGTPADYMSLSYAAGTPGASAGVVEARTIAVSLTGVHVNGQSNSWKEVSSMVKSPADVRATSTKAIDAIRLPWGSKKVKQDE